DPPVTNPGGVVHQLRDLLEPFSFGSSFLAPSLYMSRISLICAFASGLIWTCVPVVRVSSPHPASRKRQPSPSAPVAMRVMTNRLGCNEDLLLEQERSRLHGGSNRADCNHRPKLNVRVKPPLEKTGPSKSFFRTGKNGGGGTGTVTSGWSFL